MASKSPPPPSRWNLRRTPPPHLAAACFILFILLSFLPPTISKSSRRPISDAEVREKKNACYADIESGLWGWACKSSVTEKENCVLRCLSPQCYDLVYGGDPLEEGELDHVRGQEYKYCMHKLSLGESLDGVKGSFTY